MSITVAHNVADKHICCQEKVLICHEGTGVFWRQRPIFPEDTGLDGFNILVPVVQFLFCDRQLYLKIIKQDIWWDADLAISIIKVRSNFKNI